MYFYYPILSFLFFTFYLFFSFYSYSHSFSYSVSFLILCSCYFLFYSSVSILFFFFFSFIHILFLFLFLFFLFCSSFLSYFISFFSCPYSNRKIFFKHSLLIPEFIICFSFQDSKNSLLPVRIVFCFLFHSLFHSGFLFDRSFITGETNECETISIHCLASRLPGANQCCIVLAYDWRDIPVSTSTADTTKDAYGCPLFVSSLYLFSFLFIEDVAVLYLNLKLKVLRLVVNIKENGQVCLEIIRCPFHVQRDR